MPSAVKCKLLLYTDDSALLVAGKNAARIQQRLSSELQSIREWLIDSRLSLHLGKTETPFTRRENAYILMRFGLSFTRKQRFYHGKRSFLKTPAKVEISENSVFVFACALG